MLLGAFFDVRNPMKVSEHPARFEATRARPARDFSSGQTSRAPGHPTGNRGCWSPHRTASAARWCRAAYTRSRVNFSKGFRPDRAPTTRAPRCAGHPVRGARPPLRRISRADLVLRVRFGGRARGPGASLSGVAPPARSRAPRNGRTRVTGPAGDTATWRRPLVCERSSEPLVSRPRFGGWWERGSSGHHQKGP